MGKEAVVILQKSQSHPFVVQLHRDNTQVVYFGLFNSKEIF